MSLKYDTKSFIEMSNKVHNNKYDYSKVDYKSIIYDVIIICTIHGEFKQCARTHMRGSGCYECGVIKRAKIRTDKNGDEFFKTAKKLYGEKYSYGKFTTMYNKIEITCPKHGTCLMYPIYHIGKNSVGCRLCGCDINGIKKSIPKDKFIQKAINIHGNKYSYDNINYTNLQTEISIICNLHGEFLQRPYDHVRGIGCHQCGVIRRAESKTLSTDEFVEKAKLIHGEKYDYSKVNYTNNHIKIDIICKFHGIFKQQPTSHLVGRGCKKCSYSISKGEVEWLNHLGIPDDSNHRSVVVKIGKKRFTLDGYNPLTKTAYEYNGDWWHGNPNIYDPKDYNNIAHATFGELYKKTLEKKITLESAGYKVVSVWESDYKIRQQI